MTIQKSNLIIILLLTLIGFTQPSYAIVGHKADATKKVASTTKVKKKKMGFFKKMKLVKKIRKEIKAVQKNYKNAAKALSVFQDRLFVLGAVFLGVSLIVSILGIGGGVAWLAGLVGLAGLILIVYALIVHLT